MTRKAITVINKGDEFFFYSIGYDESKFSDEEDLDIDITNAVLNAYTRDLISAGQFKLTAIEWNAVGPVDGIEPKIKLVNGLCTNKRKQITKLFIQKDAVTFANDGATLYSSTYGIDETKAAVEELVPII